MNSSQSQVGLNSKELSRQLEYVKQQEQLRALGNVTVSKTLSADSMIEELLSKKETFQTNKSDMHHKQEPGAGVGAVPAWLATPHPVYERVWVGVVTKDGLADTQLLSSLLMSSGLSTETLGYIWSVANRTVAGSLTQPELYLALALVGLAQAGYGVNDLAMVYQLPRAPVPTLNLALLPPRSVYPNPLSVATLPEPTTFTWVSPGSVASHPAPADIDISYVSSAPMVSPKLLMDQSKVVLTPVESVSQKLSSVSKKPQSKHSGNNFTFSFPSLNESPSHTDKQPQPDEDEFTDFQSADFTPAVSHELASFQEPASDDLSVLVVGGTNPATSRSLWVAESSNSKSDLNVLDLFTSDRTVERGKEERKSDRYDVFQDVEEDKYSVFHNPLADDEDTTESSKPADNSDEEFSNFQTFPVTDNNQSAAADKYDVFRAVLFSDTAEVASDKPTEGSFLANTDAFVSTGVGKAAELDLFKNVTKEDDDNVMFGDFQESVPPLSDNVPVLDMFSSLTVSADPVAAESADDKYKALRLLEPITEQTNSADDFGEFLGADFPNSGPGVNPPSEQPSIQVRCLEACLNLLKAGLDTLSQISNPELTAEVLADSRAKTYLDCLLEVHRVSERIMNTQSAETGVSAEIRQVWQSLATFYTQTEHHPLTETAGVECGVCRSNIGPCPVVFGGLSFHSPCANLYLHCVHPVLPNVATLQSH